MGETAVTSEPGAQTLNNLATNNVTTNDVATTQISGPKHVEVFRKDYQSPKFDLLETSLWISLYDTETTVKSLLVLKRVEGAAQTDLVLNGDEIECQELKINGNVFQVCKADQASNLCTQIPNGDLVIPAHLLPPNSDEIFQLEISVVINPKENLKLTGLYKSGQMFCTQCEPHGFRRITFSLDSPDVLSTYKVHLEASKTDCPVLISNGNKIAAGDCDGNRHFAVFEDPFRKPSYLFAVVAGNLAKLTETFKTMSGRNVEVNLFCAPEDIEKLRWALKSVLKAMKWDEANYGREYDLDVFNLVCARDFNMGAMENKGLNIFNSVALLADTTMSTDADFIYIMSVVGHEYFHNWTGNRVTCRDWFQITLKEGLTVFRESEFTGDMSSNLKNRIDNVRVLKSAQFSEDAGPLAHPIRPESYISMDNFYTVTVYEKGCEVIGMYKTLLGKEGFRKGMDLYFERHDLQAVTCDDFRAAMADANGRDLTQFGLWYEQSGTPEVKVLEARWDGHQYILKLRQSTPPTPNQPTKKPLHIPIKLGLIGKTSLKDLTESLVLELTQEEQEFTIDNITEDCVLSINRGFSAPIKLHHDYEEADLAFLMSFDSDGLNRWDASQRLCTGVVLAKLKDRSTPLSTIYKDAFATILRSNLPNDEKALILSLVDSDVIAPTLEVYDPAELRDVFRDIKIEILELLGDELVEMYKSLSTSEDTMEPLDISRRQLRNTLLNFLVAKKDSKAVEIASEHYWKARIMNDKFAAFLQLMSLEFEGKEGIKQDFLDGANGEDNVVDKWFKAQALSDSETVLQSVIELSKHPLFTIQNPNRFESLVSVFTRNSRFHDPSGLGYQFAVNQLLSIDAINPQLSARGCKHLFKYSNLHGSLKELVVAELRRVEGENISPNLFEIVKKGLETF